MGDSKDDNVPDDNAGVSVMLSPQEFAEDLDVRLGRANGNVYHRKQGEEGIHDGQIMVRLKKKRFIVIDYGIVPTDADFQAAAVNPHISVPEGAGKQQCITPECTKVGIPVLLYDSAPEEPASLYMRSGLCFTCQRNLNEKRRTQRKRKSDLHPEQYISAKKFKVNGNVIELSSEAIVINGPVDDAKHHGEGYTYNEIGADLQTAVSDASSDVERLVAAVSSSSSGDPAAVAFATATAAAVAAGTSTIEQDVVAENAEDSMMEEDATQEQDAPSAMTSDDITTLYDKAFATLTKSVFLLSQWKASWDSAIATAVAHETVNDAGLADAVASAAAVVAASSEPTEGTTSMIPLLLAAESKGSKKEEKTGEVFSV